MRRCVFRVMRPRHSPHLLFLQWSALRHCKERRSLGNWAGEVALLFGSVVSTAR
jgi:hypothetical protein